MKTDAYFFEEINASERRGIFTTTLCVFKRTEEEKELGMMLSCYSKEEGHSMCDQDYVRALKFADDKKADELIEVLKDNYGYEINNLNP